MSHGQQNQPRLLHSEVSDVFVIVTCYLLLLRCYGMLRRGRGLSIGLRGYNHTIHTIHTITSVPSLHCDQCQWSGEPMPAAEQWRPADWCEAQLRATSHYTSRDKRWHTFYNRNVLLVQKYQYVFSTKCLLTSRYLCISHFNVIQTITSHLDN